MDAKARALAIAAKFGLGAPAGDGDSSALGKRKLDGDAPGLGLQKKEKIFVPVMEHPDINWLGLLIGPRAATIKAMTEKSGAKISIRGRGANKEGQASGHPEDDEDLHVTIEGSEEALAIARREVEAIVLNPEQAMKIKEQQLADLADMKNLSSGPAPGGEVSIYGPGAGAEYTESLDIPNSMVGLIIGKGGEMIQRLQLQCGCKMQVCKEDNNPAAEGKRRVTMNGLPERVSDLRNSIERLVAEKVASLRAGGGGSGTGGMSGAGARSHPALTMPVVMQVPVPDDKIGVVIGRGGSVIRAIQEKTGAQIHIPPGPDEGVQGPLQRTISIGAAAQDMCEAAQMEIFIVLQNNQQSNALPPATPGGVNANGDTVNSGIMHVPNDKIGLVIGKGGATIKDIQQRTQCHVKIPNVPDPMSNPPVRSCVLTGSETAQYMCRHEIESIMNGTKHVNQIGQVVNASYASVQQMPQQQGMMMQGQGMYGNAGMMAPNAAYGQQGMGYGAYGAQAQVGLYGQQSAYGQPQQQQQMQPQTVYGAPSSSTTAQPAVQPSPAVSTPALDTYYNDYWAYAALYGEGPARQYYGAWSPPAGTPPPLGVILPSVEAAAAAAAAATTGAPANAIANATTTTTATVTPAAPDAGTAELADSSGRNDFAAASADGASAAAPSDAVEDPEAQQAAWEKYKREYREWYEAHGKAAGAAPPEED